MEAGRLKQTKYDEFIAEIHHGGFFTGGIEEKDGSWDRVTVASYSGNGWIGGKSFWVTNHFGVWYLGTWGGTVYRMPDSDRVATFCVAWLRNRKTLGSDFSPEFKTTFGLIEVPDEEFSRLVCPLRLLAEKTAISEVVRRVGIPEDQLTSQVEWDGTIWHAQRLALPATGAFDYSMLISNSGEISGFNANPDPF